MYAQYGPYFAFIPERTPANVAGEAMGAVHAFGALGGFAGTYVVGLLGGGTKSGAAFVFLAVCLALAAVLMLFVRSGKAAQATPADDRTSDQSYRSRRRGPQPSGA